LSRPERTKRSSELTVGEIWSVATSTPLECGHPPQRTWPLSQLLLLPLPWPLAGRLHQTGKLHLAVCWHGCAVGAKGQASNVATQATVMVRESVWPWQRPRHKRRESCQPFSCLETRSQSAGTKTEGELSPRALPASHRLDVRTDHEHQLLHCHKHATFRNAHCMPCHRHYRAHTHCPALRPSVHAQLPRAPSSALDSTP
jgi:hypothetical protein